MNVIVTIILVFLKKRNIFVPYSFLVLKRGTLQQIFREV
jgi:hypothetical protein